jgi:hypothetical protein
MRPIRTPDLKVVQQAQYMLRPFNIDSTIICEEFEYMSLVVASRKVCDSDLESDKAAKNEV